MIIHAGQNLQAAIDAAAPGALLEPEAGATFLGNYTIPAKPEGAPIRVVGAATLRTPNAQPALRTLGRAARWRFADLTFAAGASTGDIVQLGDGLIADRAQVPTDFAFERCAIQADTTAKRGLQLNAAAVTLRDCRITGVKLAGQESQAICGWNGPGPFLIEDCTIEAGSIGVLFGGAQPAIADLVPSNITFRRNTVTRPLAMRGGGWVVKNLFELKNARDVSVTGNTFEHNWPDGQAGFSIVLTVRANGPNAPWSTIRNVLFEHNIVRHAAMAFNVLGIDTQVGSNGVVYPSQPMDGVTIRNNLLYGIDHTIWGGNGAFANIGGAPRNLHIEQNTVLQTGNVLAMNGAALTGFRFVGNIAKHNNYGVFGDSVGTGNPAIARYCPTGTLTGNVLAGGPATLYTSAPGNVFPTLASLMAGFVDPTAGNYRLVASSAHVGRGMDLDAIEAACLRPPPEPTLEETIQAHAEAAQAACAEFGGNWSPQDAAHAAVGRYRDALLEALGLS